MGTIKTAQTKQEKRKQGERVGYLFAIKYLALDPLSIGEKVRIPACERESGRNSSFSVFDSRRGGKRRSHVRSRNEKSRKENGRWNASETKYSALTDACTGLVYRHAQSTARY